MRHIISKPQNIKEKIMKVARGKIALPIEEQGSELHQTSLQKPFNQEESSMKYMKG